MAKIEEQQKAIHNHKSNLMDDLNDKGILGDPELCQRVIQVHQREQEKLNEILNSQRAKQEQVGIMMINLLIYPICKVENSKVQITHNRNPKCPVLCRLLVYSIYSVRTNRPHFNA